MRKADYLALAAIIARHRREALRAAAESNDERTKNAAYVRAATCADIANDFARIASVDPVQFLKACSI